jgi:hypothetical protein
MSKSSKTVPAVLTEPVNDHLEAARSSFVANAARAYGIAREYAVALNTHFAGLVPDGHWTDIKFGDKSPLGQRVEAERAKLAAALAAEGLKGNAAKKRWYDIKKTATSVFFGIEEDDLVEGEGEGEGETKAKAKVRADRNTKSHKEKFGEIAALVRGMWDEKSTMSAGDVKAIEGVANALLHHGFSSIDAILSMSAKDLRAGKLSS